MSQLPFKGPKNAERRLAQPGGLFQHCIEYRGEIAWGRIDDLQDLGQGRLAGQHFVALAPQSRDDFL
jgi:hypothetical protein